MRILLSNDDGIHAPGLKVLEDIARTLSDDIWIVAPAEEQSGAGRSLTLSRPLRVRQFDARRFAVSGTPTDAVMMALAQLMPAKPDLILSGVNRGANLGMETVFSGTVGGAMTGMMLGIPSIALSQVYNSRSGAPVPWDVSRMLGARVVRQLLDIGWPASTCLNINFPDRPLDEVGPATLCRQGIGLIAGMHVETRVDPRKVEYHWIGFRREAREQGPDSDSDVVAAGAIAVTPVRYDRTDEPAFEQLAKHLPRLGR